MEILYTLITGTTGALFMVIFGIFSIFTLSLYIPFRIATDEKCLFESRVFNVFYGIVSAFLPLLSLIYAFFNWRVIAKGYFISIAFLGIAVLIFILRSFVSIYFMPV